MHSPLLAVAAAMREMLESLNSLAQKSERKCDEYDIEYSNDTRFTTDRPIHNPRNNRKTKKSSKR